MRSRIYGKSLRIWAICAPLILGFSGAASAWKQGTLVNTGSMEETRSSPTIGIGSQVNFFTATLLKDGRVLVVGGSDSSGNPLCSAELYNPTTKSFSPTGSLNFARSGHTATLLDSGRVLIAGGASDDHPDELYDPSTGNFILTGASSCAGDTATKLNDGTVLLATGVFTHIYDPKTETCAALPVPLNPVPRLNSTATLLKTGEVLIAGGHNLLSRCGDEALSTAILYEPSSGSFVDLGPIMLDEREQATATLLRDGKVLIAGGLNFHDDCLDPHSSTLEFHASAELFDPTTRTFSGTGEMTEARAGHTATLLPNGEVLMAGGFNTFYSEYGGLPGGPTNAIYYSELYNPLTGTFHQTGSMLHGRVGPAAVRLRLRTREVLVLGGLGFKGVPLSSAELYSY